MRNIWIAGWLLVAYQGAPIGWYPEQDQCKDAGKFYDSHFTAFRCVPDRFEWEEGGEFYVKPKVE